MRVLLPAFGLLSFRLSSFLWSGRGSLPRASADSFSLLLPSAIPLSPALPDADRFEASPPIGDYHQQGGQQRSPLRELEGAGAGPGVGSGGKRFREG